MLLISVEIFGKIRVGENNDPHIHVVTEKETETEITVYGLRGLAYSKEATEALRRKRAKTGLSSQMTSLKFMIIMLKISVMGNRMRIS